MSTRRQFLSLSVVATAGAILPPARDAEARDLPQLAESEPTAAAMRYVHDASTVDASTRPNPAAEQNCANCALIQGADGAAWRPCPIFPGHLVAETGWCSVWAPRS
ncbi:MAG: high-potential iron-sulfur protein [Pseudomonadota bacterium]